MNKGVKIIVGVMIFLGILSGVFLWVAKNKKQTTPADQSQVEKKSLPVVKNSTVLQSANTSQHDSQVVTPQTKAPKVVDLQDRKNVVRAQWNQCKTSSLAVNTNLAWSIQITEEIPPKGTYAKGNLEGDSAFPVHVIIKADSQLAEKIKTMLVLGKTAFLRGTCLEVASDGSVVLQAF